MYTQGVQHLLAQRLAALHEVHVTLQVVPHLRLLASDGLQRQRGAPDVEREVGCNTWEADQVTESGSYATVNI